jgi:serine/threonine protein kinase
VNTAAQLSSLGKYRLIATIGHGGMAHIHLALMAGPAGFNKLLVIKALRDDIGVSAEEFVTMFLDEARLAARLSHANIVQTYEVGEVGGRYFIAMEYLEGQSLKLVERRLRPHTLPMPLQLRVLSEVAKGLHHAHELRGFDGEALGVVHRDVSPHNVFVTYDGQVKLLDFGIAKAANAMHLTKVGVIKGKAEYISPEQIRGEGVDRRADVFSLGVMMWEALTGKRFAGGPDVAEITKMHNRLTGGEAKLRSVRNDLPERLVHICERALSVQREKRQPSALEFSQEIEAYLAKAGLNPTSQQLSDIVSPHFQQEREQLRRLIDQQMKLALDPSMTFGATMTQLPVLARQTFSSGVWQMPGNAGPMGNTPTTSIRQAYPNTAALPNTQPFTTTQSSPSFTGTNMTQAMAQPPEFGSHLVPPRRTVPWPTVVALVLLVVGVATYFAVKPADNTMVATALPSRTTSVPARPEQPEPEPAPTVPAPKQEAEPPARPVERAEQLVKLNIRVQPEDAEVLLDGARLNRLPFEAQVRRSSTMHTLEISAAGYEVHREMLTYDRDLSVRVKLVKEVHSSKRPSHPDPRHAAPVASAHAPEPVAPAQPAQRESPSVEPGMDFRRIAPPRPNIGPGVSLEEDPYR